MSTSPAFDRLHDGIQRCLWDMRWTELRPVQAAAIHHIMDDRGDCIITVPTAGGKTEAAFLPVLSLIADDFNGGVRAMYIGPLKALINDQFRRVADLCSRISMPVHRWHGDVGDGARKQFLSRPAGVLLITPESLEAMFVLRPTKMRALFERLAYVVIDEVHAFMGTERGAQLQSQLERLSARAGCRPIRIGLSATLGDPSAALEWLRPGPSRATLLQDVDAHRELHVRVRGFWCERPRVTINMKLEVEIPEDPMIEIARAILVAVRGTTTLVFANRKATIETLADTMIEEAKALGVRDAIVVHHGSLSKAMREEAEQRLSSDAPCTAVCSNTLEMGIDIGQITNVVQVSAPPSVASLTQRIGRSGRSEGAPAQLRAYFQEDRPDSTSSVWDRLHLDFLRGVASIELMRKRFVEPIDIDHTHGSTLVQQILSSLAESGGIEALSLHERLVRSGAFGALSPATFASLLRSLSKHALIEQMHTGELILAPAGQTLISHYSFYAAFKTPDEMSVFDGSQRIGTLPSDLVPPTGDHVILAGKRWRVVQIDVKRKEVTVQRARGKRPPMFNSAFADAHPAVHAEMRALAVGTDVPAYLDETAAEILSSLRVEATRLGQFQPAIMGDGDRALVFLWAGKRVSRTLHLALRLRDVEVTDHDIGLEVALKEQTLRSMLQDIVSSPPSVAQLSALAETQLGARQVHGEKYDAFLPDEFWLREYARKCLDVTSAFEAIDGLRRG